MTNALLDSGDTASMATRAPARASLPRRLWSSPGGRVATTVLALVVLFGLCSLVGIRLSDPGAQNPGAALHGPGWSHPLGTDEFGRDMLSRVQSGIVLSLQISVVAVAICAILGTLGGVVAGYFGGPSSAVIMSVSDLLFAVPSILLALAIVSALGHGWFNSSLAVGISYIPIFVRVVRGPVLAIRQADFVRAGRLLGFSRGRLLWRHVLPAVGGVLVVQTTLALGWAVLTEASLSFLGLGPPPPAQSLGSMVSDGTNYAGVAWWLLLFPAVAVVILVTGFNLVGDVLRDVLDPTSRDG